MSRFITSEYVSCGHPDKMADYISDAVLDAYLEEDSNSRCGIETMVKDNTVVLGGEVHSNAKNIDIEKIVRDSYRGFHFPESHNLSPENIKIINLIGQQSNEIHNGVDKEDGVIGAGDQGFMVGFCSNETDCGMPLGHAIARLICSYIACTQWYEDGIIGPDAKSQVIVEYDKDQDGVEHATRIVSILVSTMHSESLSLADLREKITSVIRKNIIRLDEELYDKFIYMQDIDIQVNPCGEWHIGGPVSDCGVTGRKIVVDAYGGYCNVGGGAWSGKDFTKVDRSSAYMARYIAKNIVFAGLADTAKVTLSYTIGIPYPSSINIELNKNHKLEDELSKWFSENIDLTPSGIMKRFEGTKPRFKTLVDVGHVGINNPVYINDSHQWEKTDLVERLKEQFA